MVEIYDDWVFDTFRMPGAINIAPFPLAHDEQAPCFGFTVQDRAGNKLGYVPDTHHVPEESLENLFDCQVLILEFNYHLNELIENCPYPDDLKERIALTHMENECSGETVSYLAWEGMKYLVPFHLSETNNSDDMVQYEADRGLGEYQENVTVIIARQKGWGGKVYTVI
jgi:phosphoribosyl 1,2-cyclic phosphodiesterase